ncbi:MFS transporter [Tundrisphaera lichenicola]|uniref:MFS transporter n=1 Tax=Tundrisphaera lichenicola TaxID=2029860 RepID=UPI003EB78280
MGEIAGVSRSQPDRSGLFGSAGGPPQAMSTGMTNPPTPEDSVSPDRRIWHGLQLRKWTVLAMLPPLLMTGMNSTVTDLARPFIVTELSSDRYRYQWVTGLTLLGAVGGMSIINWARARFGLKRAFLVGLVLFTLGSLAMGLSPNFEILGVARFLQSWGNGMVVTTVLALLWREFPEDRDASMALYVLGLYFGRILAPSVSAYLINLPSWRSIFLVNVPVAAVAVLLTSKTLQPDQPPQERHRERLDLAGLALLFAWIGCLILGLYRFQKWGWETAGETWLVAGLGILAFSAFLIREFTAEDSLLNLYLFGRSRFALAVIIKALADTNFFTVLAILTRYMAVTRDYQRSTTGLVLLPAVASMGATLLLSARFGTRRDRKGRLILGLSGMAVMSWVLASIDLYTDKHWISAMVALWAASAGLVASPLICISQEDMTMQEVAASSCIKNLGLVLPSAIGGGLIAIFSERRTDAQFDALRLAIEPNRPALIDVSQSLADRFATRGLDPVEATSRASGAVAEFVRDNASVYAQQASLQLLALIVAVGILLAFLLKPLPPHASGPIRG